MTRAERARQRELKAATRHVETARVHLRRAVTACDQPETAELYVALTALARFDISASTPHPGFSTTNERG